MFWDLEPNAGVDSSKLETLIGQSPTDWSSVLKDSELFSAIRAKEEYLVIFFGKEENISSLIDYIFSTDDEKAKKSGIGLFYTQESPLLNTLLKSQKLCENLISRIESEDYVDMGYISRIFQQSLSYLKTNTQQIFQNSKIILKTIISKMNESSIFELLDSYIFSLDVEEMWVIWSLFKLIVPPITIPKVFENKQKEISELHSELTKIEFTMRHRVNIMILISKFVTQNQVNSEISPILHPILPKLLKATQNEDFIAIVLQLAIKQKPSQQVANFALEYAKRPLPMSKVGVLSLQYIAKYPSKQTLVVFPDLLDSFLQEKNNTFHLDAFTSLISNGMKISDFRKIIIEKMVPILLKECSFPNWRKNASTIGYYLNIAMLLDKHVSNDNEEWMKLRNNELTKWNHKEDGAIDISGFSQNSTNTKLGDDLIFNENNKQTSEANQQNSIPENNNQEEIKTNDFTPSFPAFEETQNNEPDTKQQNQQLDFPTFEEPQKQATPEQNAQQDKAEKVPENNEKQQIQSNASTQDDNKTETQKPSEKANEGSDKPKRQSKTKEHDPLYDPDQMKKRAIPDDVENDYTPVSQEQPKEIVYTFNIQKRAETDDSNLDISFTHFQQLLNDECWESQPTTNIAKLFDTEDKLASPEAAYLTLIKNN